MFGGFFFILVGMYFFYYTGMIGYDLYTASKESRDESVAHEVDISGIASSYKAKDVRSMFQDSSNSIQNIDNEESSDNTNTGGIAQYIGNEYQEGTRIQNLTDIFVQESQTASIFSNISMAM